MKNGGLTEKNMKNKRFYKTEKAIFMAYYKLRDFPNAKRLAKRAGIARTTFYRHHKSPQTIPYDHEEYLLKCYDTQIKKLLKNPKTELRAIFLRVLIFIHGHREIIGVLLKDGRTEVVDKMLLKLEDRVVDEWNLAGDLDRVFQIYANEVLGVIEAWAKGDFSSSELDKTLSEIMFLTKTTSRRLAPLIS